MPSSTDTSAEAVFPKPVIFAVVKAQPELVEVLTGALVNFLARRLICFVNAAWQKELALNRKTLCCYCNCLKKCYKFRFLFFLFLTSLLKWII